MNLKRRPRTLAALMMLAAMGFGTAEAVAGESADASEHYEDALSHVHEHSGPDDGRPDTIEPDHDVDDQHIQGFDHCGHAHGSSVRPGALPAPGETIIRVLPAVDVLTRPPDSPATGLYLPPKP